MDWQDREQELMKLNDTEKELFEDYELLYSAPPLADALDPPIAEGYIRVYSTDGTYRDDKLPEGRQEYRIERVIRPFSESDMATITLRALDADVKEEENGKV